MIMNLEEGQREIFKIYKYALIHIGVDFTREDVQEALELSVEGIENACRATIDYWRTGKMQYPSAFFIKALYEKWQPYQWDSTWMNDPNFISPGQKWWKDAEGGIGKDLRNALVVDVIEPEQGAGYIVFANGRTLTIKLAQAWGWQKVLEYAQVPKGGRCVLPLN
ncbi:MAG: hypothetical protein KME08_21615 [Aphanothece sp. CMT-3BRIN-NPC111]|nr:hypothetical protein [Aphanothece sp. CMT-3BRIN-NPC111]